MAHPQARTGRDRGTRPQRAPRSAPLLPTFPIGQGRRLSAALLSLLMASVLPEPLDGGSNDHVQEFSVDRFS